MTIMKKQSAKLKLETAALGGEEDFPVMKEGETHSHRPEQISLYGEEDLDLVFSGHAHGGQFRLPLVGGLAAPDQGLFPKYDAGLFKKGNTIMVVSRGLGNSVFPIRINNRPELVVIEIY